MILTPNANLRKYIVQLTCQLASNKYQKVGLINFERHVMPSVINDFIGCMHFDVEDMY